MGLGWGGRGAGGHGAGGCHGPGAWGELGLARSGWGAAATCESSALVATSVSIRTRCCALAWRAACAQRQEGWS
eukprot:2384561-Prymnesium_polylepis.1